MLKGLWIMVLPLLLVVCLALLYVLWGRFSDRPQALYTNTTADEIIVLSPLSATVISSPLLITGMARGRWYFEATAPVVLVDWDGKIIAEGYVTAEGDWMTEEFVPFVGTLTFTRPAYGEVGTLILRADNPSGLPKYDRALEIPIRFEER